MTVEANSTIHKDMSGGLSDAGGAVATADDVLRNADLRGKRFLVTGTSTGTGQEMARALLAHGATVVGTMRDPKRYGDEIAEFNAAAADGGGQFFPAELDLGSLRSVRACADRLLSEGAPFNGVIASAGIMAAPFSRTEDGFESQFATNHLGHFVLVNRIAPLVQDGARVVVLSSNGHRGGDVDLDDPNFERRPYDPWKAYEQSKTANVQFAVEFDRRHGNRGVRACAVMPGTSDTRLMRHLSPQAYKDVFARIAEDRDRQGLPPLKMKSVEQMAATPLWAAIVADPALIGGRYLENCHVAEVDDVPGIRDGVMSYAIDPERAKRLWEKSEELVGERF